MSNKETIGILSTLSSPLLPLLMKMLQSRGLSNFIVIIDKKDFSIKDKKIWDERTSDKFNKNGLSAYDLKCKNCFYLVSDHNCDDCIDLIVNTGVTLLINGGTPRKLIANVLNKPRRGIINVHPGILPNYRGACCVEWAILNNDQVGNTSHFMAEGYDDGPIIKIEKYRFPANYDYNSIRTFVYEKSIELMASSINTVLDNDMTPLDGIDQEKGHLYKPISEEQLTEVINKISEGKYKYIETK